MQRYFALVRGKTAQSDGAEDGAEDMCKKDDK